MQYVDVRWVEELIDGVTIPAAKTQRHRQCIVKRPPRVLYSGLVRREAGSAFINRTVYGVRVRDYVWGSLGKHLCMGVRIRDCVWG